MSNIISLLPYTSSMQAAWDDAVSRSFNGTFLFQRSFMDYHAERFVDCSLVFSCRQRVVALLPASLHDGVVVSHGGLTYGGLIVTPHISSVAILEAYQMAVAHYASLGYTQLVVKPVPHIYHSQAADEELYALFRLGAVRTACGLSSAVNLRDPLPLHTLRHRCVRKATQAQLTLLTSNQHLDAFHALLADNLACRHAVTPVHTASEMRLLASRFEREIQLATVFNGERLVAGAWLFVTPRTVHVQYIATNDEGRSLGALDLLFSTLIDHYRDQHDWLDFGISTEHDGSLLNHGLLTQKEGFGARGITYDRWQLTF